MGYLTVPRSCLHVAARHVESGDASAAKKPLVRADRFDYPDTLRALLVGYLPEGYPSTTFAATLMNTSVRTLHRKLSAYNLSYAAMIDEVRFNAAKNLLLDANLQIEEVARAVGFDDASHFARMFRRIGGLSPKMYRKTAFS
jgi:AraC-like DNA-binding protein